MRRLCSIFAFAVLSLTLLPARADAYIWAWLDDLSGPRFAGVVVEAQFACTYTSAANDLDTIWRLRREIEASKLRYGTMANATGTGRAYYLRAIERIGIAEGEIDAARKELEAKPKVDVTAGVLKALILRHSAAENFAWAEHLRAGGDDDPTKRPKSDELLPEWIANRRPDRYALIPGFGLNVSVCGAKPLHRERRFWRADIGFGWDVKEETKAQKNRMLIVGASHHWAIAPYFTFGAGAGVARFSTRVEDGRRDFSKLYIQPTIIDFRPAALVRDANLRSPWLHVFFIRHSVIVFPKGFDQGQFGGTSEAYPREYVSSIGVHADIAPLIRKWRKSW